MPLVSASTTHPAYDVIVIGSGAGGGQAAYTLTMEGAKVLMLEAGRHYDPITETPMFQLPSHAPLRGANTPDKANGFYDATVDGGWEIPGEPYTNATADSATRFHWWRARMLGGRTNHWTRIALRNGPYDFKPHTRDGLGFDWPLTYDELAPYYDKVELLIGVHGTNEGIENAPDSSPGVLQPPPKARAGELLAQHHARKLGIPIIPIRRAVLTAKQDADTLPARIHPGNLRAQRLLADSMRTRAVCFWATPCGRGCSIRATYQSPTVHLPPALASGNLDLLPNAMVREITVNAAGRATGVVWIDKLTGTEHARSARAIVVAGGACESVRLLLNSRSAHFPDGLGNTHGFLGRRLMETVGTSLGAYIPALENLPPHNDDGAGGPHVYAPWWLHHEAERLGFPRGYHIDVIAQRRMPTVTTGTNLEALNGGNYGRQFKADQRRYYGAFVNLAGRGEMIPNEHSFCTLDPTLKDRWGLPVLRFHWRWSDHETRQVAHMRRTFAELLTAMGAKSAPSSSDDGAKAIGAPGRVNHEVGGATMGDAPENSVTNAWGQLWDAKNVVVADAATFASNSEKNPTLTIMALAWRACDHLLAEFRRGDL
ncbi:MAG: GMC family oxidoreductase [Undibacterium sp.]|nr:GMC family oxidoreductase [Opitutaceae bacterium]